MEVELKVRIDEDIVVKLRNRLGELGARREEARTQDDLFFQHPSRDFAATDETLRFRTEVDARELTYKGKRMDHDAKSREELNVPVGEDPTKLLEVLGFTQAARMKKTREPWQMDGVEVAIDHVEGLGWFVEIEAKDHPDPHGHIEHVREVLDLVDAEALSRSYLEMALESGAAAATQL